MTPDGDSVNLIYRKQAARLDELEKENKRLAKELQEAEKRWRHSEEELEDLRETSGDVAELKSRAQKAEAQMDELTRMVRLSSFMNLISIVKRNLITPVEARKYLSPTAEFAASIPLEASCFFSQPGYRFFQSTVFVASAT